MAEPATTTIFGYKPAMVIFAIIGSALSLQFAKKLNWWQGIVTVFTGALIAIVAVPAWFDYKHTSATQPMENAASFFCSFFAMAIIAMIFRAFEKLDIAEKINKLIDKKMGL